MIRDPLYLAILRRLDDPLDDKVFELFAVDIVRQEFPSAVPVVGGSDAGLDGAVGNLTGPRIPIIATTSNRVRDNVRRNVKRYKGEWKEHSGGLIVATSAALNPRRQKNVFDLVKELGFHLVHLYERGAIAERLYYTPRWRLELLGLPGDPPALTQLPPRIVASPTDLLVGRDDDLEWLADTAGNRMLFGLPASGKTFLLEGFARENDGYFVNTSDPAAIADGVRELQPKALIVDDAHAKHEVLAEVIRVRSSTGAQFDIITTAWTGPHEQVREALGLPSTQVRELSLLRRRQIAEVINETGIAGPGWLMRSLLDQADGRVGLAVTLARLCLLGDVEEVVFGEALLRVVRSALDEPGGLNATTLLAPFAVGGRDGLPLEEVAGIVGESALQLQAAMARIGSAGFVLPRTSFRGIRTLSVVPATLREALVRHVFFEGVATLDIQQLLALVTRPCEAARTLIGCRHQGGHVPSALLREWMGRCDDPDTWKSYAYLGPKEASWVLEQRPDLLPHVDTALLARVPEQAIPALLSIAVGDSRELHSHPEHGLRVLHDWVKAGLPGSGDGLARRRALIEGILEWTQEDESRNEVAQHALCLALDPEFGDTKHDPVEDASVTIRWGLATTEELLEILQLWGRALAFFHSADEVKWTHLLELLRTWIYLGDPQGVPEEVTAVVKPFVQGIIDDVGSLARDHPGVLTELHQHAVLRNYVIPEPEDATFRVLFPVHSEYSANHSNGDLVKAALRLASRWARGEPEAALAEIGSQINEARIAGISWPDLTPNVLQAIADENDDPVAWLDAAIRVGLPPGMEQPFLLEVVRQQPDGWYERLIEFLADQDRGIPSAAVVICFDDLPEAVIDHAIELLSRENRLVQSMWLQDKIPVGNQRRILGSPQSGLAAAAAVAEWWCERRGRPHPDLAAEWRQAVLHLSPDEYHLKEILAGHPSLATPWLEAQMHYRVDYVPLAVRTALVDALRLTDVSGWPEVIEALEGRTNTWSLVHELVVDDPERYAALLGEPDLVDYHLAPLAGPPGACWAELVRLAIANGLSHDRIAPTVVHGDQNVRHGPESAYWSAFLEAFPDPEPDDAEIANVIAQCRTLIQEQLRSALDREKHETIHGDDR